MATEPIEEITVKLEADYQDFLKQIDRAVEEAARKLKDVDEAPKKARSSWEQLGSYLKGQFLPIVAGITAAFSVQGILGSINGLIGSIQGLGAASVQANASFETFTTQFTTLLGTTSEAKKRIDELAQFGQATPFELPQIVEADRLLQTFGGTALATGENLRRIGDSAAGVNANFQEVSFWTGRLYAAIQAGRPFGEASARLQELGILTGDVRSKLEDMQKAGASGTEIWEAYAEMIDSRFTGAMDKLSKTFQGVMSNIADFQGMLLREGGATFFEGLRQDAIDFYDVINQPEVKESLVNLAEAFGSIADTLREAVTSPLLEGLKDVDPQDLNQLASSLEDFSRAVGRLFSGDNQANINTTIDLLTSLVDALTLVTQWIGKLVPMIEAGGQALAGFINPLSNIPAGLFAFANAIEKVTGYDLGDWSRGAVDALDSQSEAADAAKGAYQGMREAISSAGDAAEEAEPKIDALAEAVAAAQEKAAALVGDFGDAIKDNNEKLADLEADHGDKIAEIAENLAEKQADALEQRNEAIADLEEELAERRQEIAENTAEALADLAEDTEKRRVEIIDKASEDIAKVYNDTNDQIAKLKEDAEKKEKRETEDHQKEMKKLQRDYLFDLEDAVKNRDARAIVDLRRRLQKEKSEKEKDFKTDQKRDDEDLNDRIIDLRKAQAKRQQEIMRNEKKELEQLKEAEAEKREEILEKQAEQLEDLNKYEAKKRADIEESYQEQMAKAEEAYQEQMARENERYDERKQALDEAIQKRLEDIAKGLSDEKDITEEGAKAILESLMKTFGVDGDIDQLMNEFMDRRRQKLTIQIDVENEIRQTDTSSSYKGTPGERGNMGGPRPRFQFGGIVPGPMGSPVSAIVHGGEEIVPVDEVSRLNQMRSGMMSGGAIGNPMKVVIEHRGSAPPGIRGPEIEQISAVLVKALDAAGVRAKR